MLFLISQTKNIYFQRQHHNSFHPGRGQKSHRRKGTWRSATVISLCSVANVCAFLALTTLKSKTSTYEGGNEDEIPMDTAQEISVFFPPWETSCGQKTIPERDDVQSSKCCHHKENKWWGWRAGLAVKSKLRLVPRTHIQ